MKKTTLIFAIVILASAVGGWYFLSRQGKVEEPTSLENEEIVDQVVEEETEEIEEETEAETEETEEKEPETNEEENEEKENPYLTAKTVEPIEDDNITMHEEFSAVLEEVFGEEPKLIGTGGITRLRYIVNRVISADDVMEAKNLLAEKGYELKDSNAGENKYDLDLSISEDVLENKYDGSVGGSMSILFWTTEAQKVEIKTL